MSDIKYEAVDNLVDKWHRNAEDTRSLQEALGMTVEQYGVWLATGCFLEGYEPPRLSDKAS